MAGGKETPRQKMIGMMYLVLTALLALNVSKEILHSFVVINESLQNTNEILAHKNGTTMNQFEQQMAFDPEKTRPYFLKAQTITQEAEKLDEHIEDLKRFLIKETAGYDENEPDSMYSLNNVDAKDNYDIPTNILIGSEPNNPTQGEFTALDLKAQMQSFQASLLSVFDASRDEEIINEINESFQFEDIPTAEGGLDKWEVGNFYHVPLAACVTNLSKIQTDIKTIEADALKELLANINVNTFKFDTIEAKLIPRSNYVLQGEPYTADVFLAAYSKTEQPRMSLGVLDTVQDTYNVTDSLTVANGLGQINLESSSVGIKQFDGLIELKKQGGGYETFPFKGEYIVAAPSLTVAPTKMNVMYKGVANPLDISVPGVANENVRVSITGGNQIRKTGDGQYEVTLSNQSPRQVFVEVTAVLENGETRSMGRKEFRAKQLPKPYAKIGEIENSGLMSANELIAQSGIRSLYGDNFEFELPSQVKRFEMETVYQGNVIKKQSNNNRFTNEMVTIMRNVRAGTQLVFKEIKSEGNDGVEHELSPLVVTIR